MSRFKDLLERFLADDITAVERLELFGLIRSGYFSDELGASFMDEVTVRQAAPHILQPVTEEIFSSLEEAYSKEDKIIITVKHGEVEVSDRRRLRETLAPGEQLDVTPSPIAL